MGVDVYGHKRGDDESFEAFEARGGACYRSNWWYWRPLWDWVYAHSTDILTEKEHDLGHYNCGPLLDQGKTAALAKRLRELITNGEHLVAEARFKAVHPETLKSVDGSMGAAAAMKVIAGWHQMSAEAAVEFCEFLEKASFVEVW